MFWLLIEFVELNRYPLACVQALRGGGGEEGELETTSLELEYLHRKVNAKC